MSDTAARPYADGVPRPIRSFKLRRGRVTPAQQRALDAYWPVFGVSDDDCPLDVAAVFGRVAPVVLEIGFGMGETTAELAAAQPDRDVLAVDVHTPGAGALLAAVGRLGLQNVRVLLGDAVPLLRDRLPAGAVSEVRVFFPDPWPKARHTKRRLLDAGFVALVADRLAPGGVLHVATDWPPYAAQVLAVVEAEPRLANPYGGPAPRPPWRPVTRFERQGLARGHVVQDVIAVRRDGMATDR